MNFMGNERWTYYHLPIVLYCIKMPKQYVDKKMLIHVEFKIRPCRKND